MLWKVELMAQPLWRLGTCAFVSDCMVIVTVDSSLVSDCRVIVTVNSSLVSDCRVIVTVDWPGCVVGCRWVCVCNMIPISRNVSAVGPTTQAPGKLLRHTQTADAAGL
jgi:hypothetical protein